ncbi:cold-shock protein [Bacillus pseudomycoides]|uniref:cold-shock protein n=1 Tax=Bacillus pseudomycoides TaxID=64104 RepID=UPI000BED360C|nr:cold-shock protein [Bacillus pseudomycoides]PEE41406.1 cold-shock protein [Bacillus pseudomycoides]PEI92376.1 cold-shock protein [Bacillus pseudomycoides]PGA94989.1 cold-shock protein [Bacillus pseudomycoides]PHF35200.1 cold-shock protein [Bacillus pseudomycoides]
MLVMENRRRELADATAVKVVKGLLFSEETSSITSLENIVKDTVQFNVVEQEMIDREYIPKEVKPFFDKKGAFLYRVSSVSYKEKVLSENLIFADTSLLPNEIVKELEDGNVPIEKLVEQMEVRKNMLYQGYQPSGNIIELFDGCLLQASIYPTRKYQIISDRKCVFYICEAYHAESIYEVMK